MNGLSRELLATCLPKLAGQGVAPQSSMVVDPDGYSWMVGTHKAEPTSQQMKKKMVEQMKQQPTSTATAA